MVTDVRVTGAVGERTPVSTRMSNPPASIPAHWIECKTARAFHAAVHDVATGAAPVDAQTFFQSVLHPSAAGEKLMPVRKLVERRDGTHVEGEWYVNLFDSKEWPNTDMLLACWVNSQTSDVALRLPTGMRCGSSTLTGA